MNQQTKTCQNSGQKYCEGQFVIEPEDFVFYEKIKVPSPTFCPTCRLQRRMIWMKGLDLFYRKCDLCSEMKLSMYHPDAPYVVFCDRCWWSDKWDAQDYAMDYDPTQTFFEQWNELLHKTPILGLSIDKSTGESSSFCNHTGNAKNCSLLFYADYNEDCMNGYMLSKNRNVLDSSPIIECENCYDSSNCFKNYGVHGSQNSRNNIDSYFLNNCDNCNNCFGSSNLRNGQYYFFNQKLTKEEYQAKIDACNLGSRANYNMWKQKAREHWKAYPERPMWDDFSIDSTGSYYFKSKNCKSCFEVQFCEDSKYCMLIKAGVVRDSYDYTDWGVNSECIYECMTVGEHAKDVYFTHESGFSIFDIQYSKLSTGGSHHFGCVSLKKPQYCILNKSYSKEEYESLKTQIIKDMKENLYIAKDGNTYSYGEFFPLEFSPHAYNDTFAARFFPLDESEVLDKGLSWSLNEKKQYPITIQALDLPDSILDATDSVLKEVIQCPTCPRGYKILRQEYDFLKKHTLPLPHSCPFCRIWDKVDTWIGNMKLTERVCSKCNKDFATHLKKESHPTVLCKECWRLEYV